MTQEELLPQIYKKDDNGLTLLYDMYSKSLYSVIYNLVRDQNQAEEILQDTFVKIWNSIDSYNQNNGRFYTWILNLARTTALEKLNSKSDNSLQNALKTDNFVSLLDNNNQQNHNIETIGIREFVKKLKPKCIQTIDLLFFKGYNQQQASEELQIGIDVVKSQNRNCITDLRNFLHL